jgi:hypothetical protein
VWWWGQGCGRLICLPIKFPRTCACCTPQRVRDGVQQGRCNEAVKPAQYWFERDESSHTLASTSRDYLGAKRGSSGEKLALHDDMSLLKCWNVCFGEERCRGYGSMMGVISSFRVLWMLGSFARTSVESGKMPKSTTYRTRKIAVRFAPRSIGMI